MAKNLPYMLSNGLIPKILGRVQEALRPERFTQDFLETKLGYSGGSARPIISILKRMGFLSSDGIPTALYDHFRDPATEGLAIAEGLRSAYSELFQRNEYVYVLARDKLTSLVLATTGAAKGSRVAKATVGTFWVLKEMANFEGAIPAREEKTQVPKEEPESRSHKEAIAGLSSKTDSVDFKVSYTINLNLPETSDPEVFNAIFKSLKEHLLGD